MKKNFTLSLTIFIVIGSYAQTMSFQSTHFDRAGFNQTITKEQVMRYRVINFVSEQYVVGNYEPTDSVEYVYDPSLPHGYGNFDFIFLSNFYFELLFYSCIYMYYDTEWEPDYVFYNFFNDDDLRFA